MTNPSTTPGSRPDQQPPGGWTQPGSPVPPPQPYGGQPAPWTGQPGAGYPGTGHPGQAAGYPPPGAYGLAQPLRTDYARWPRRAAALLIDQALGLVASAVFTVGYVEWLVGVARSGENPDLTGGLVWLIVGAVLSLASLGLSILNRWIRGGRTGQSLGKRVLRIKLIGELTDQPVGALNAFLRDLVHVVDGFAYVGYLWPLWDERRQTFADKIMRTVVVDAPRLDESHPVPGPRSLG